ncbi:MAG TPA: M28 family peptidase, partial [Longimicrobiales bacterium]
MKRHLPALLLAALLLPAAARAQRIDTLEIRTSTSILADDSMQGRGTGSAGEHMAARYLVSELRRLGLHPVGAGGSYLLPVPLKQARVEDAATRVVVRQGADSSLFGSGRDFVVNTGGAGAFHDFSGDAVLVGAPADAARALSSAGELRGKVVVVLGALGGDASKLVPAWIRAGVAGVVLLVPDAANFALYARSRGDSRFFVDAPVNDPVWQPDLPELIAGPELTRALVAGAPIPDSVGRGKPLAAPVALGRSLAAAIRMQVAPVASANVAGLLPGRDPALRDQVVVYTAHYDHLGISTPDARGDSIYNGFSDNAAGDGMLLAIAEAMLRDRPARSVLFLFPTGEERGLLGSTYYAFHPAIPLERTVAVINLDAGAPPAPPVSWRFAAGTASSLGDVAKRIVQGHGWSAVLGGTSPNSD